MIFENKTILITGANGGLAFVFIETLLKQNIKKIYCTARDIEKLENLKKLSEKIEIFSLDITKKEDLESIVSQIENIDILINNAGVNSGKRVLDKSEIDFDVSIFSLFFIEVKAYTRACFASSTLVKPGILNRPL